MIVTSHAKDENVKKSELLTRNRGDWEEGGGVQTICVFSKVNYKWPEGTQVQPTTVTVFIIKFKSQKKKQILYIYVLWFMFMVQLWANDTKNDD